MSNTTDQTNERLGGLEQRVGGLEQGFSRVEGGMAHITNSLKGLSDDLKVRSAPQYPVLIGFATLLFAILGFVGTSWKAPIETQLSTIAAEVKRLEGDYVPKWVVEREWNRGEKERDRLRTEMEAVRDRR